MTGRTRWNEGPRPRLLATDIDGTLIAFGSHPTPAVRLAISLLMESGVQVICATGRSPWHGLQAIVGAIGISGPQITLHGALIADPVTGEVVRGRPIDPARLEEIVDLAASLGLNPTFGTAEGNRFVLAADQAALAEVRALPTYSAYLPATAATHAELVAAARRRLGDRHAFTWGDESGIEVLAPGTDKSEALAWVAAERGIPMAEVAAVGDAANDMGMLAMAGASVAMGGAKPEVRAVASHVTRSPEEDGLVHAIRWLFPDLDHRLRG